MSQSSVAVVGSGIVGTTIAYLLTKRGYDVVLFEKGPEYPYPHTVQFQERMRYKHENSRYRLPADLKNLTLAGDYQYDIDSERPMVVGGSATEWLAETLRMRPQDFNTQTRYEYAGDWPLGYDDLEADYCEAEHLLGVSGTDADNPFAPPRSRPYPLPPFELSADDRILAERLREHGIVLHTTPQARTRLPYETRPACMNHGSCSFCPIGARYSPNYHVALALKTGLCTLHTNTSVRRVVFDGSGRARAIVYRPNDATADREHSAKAIVIAAGAIESARLLLLSAGDPHPDGIRPDGHLGRHLVFHHFWINRLHYREAFFPGSIGAATGRCHQFLDPAARGRHGGIKVEFSSDEYFMPGEPLEYKTGPEIVAALTEMRHWRLLSLHAESAPSDRKFVALSDKRDRFGDAFAHVQYESADFDHETYQFGQQLVDKFAAATGAEAIERGGVYTYSSAAHHMGSCRMGVDAADSVVDRFGKVHGSPNLYVIGGSNFVGSSALQPTLTMVALAIRATRHIVDQLL